MFSINVHGARRNTQRATWLVFN